MKALVVSDCNHADFQEERAVAARNGLEFRNLMLLGKPEEQIVEALQRNESGHRGLRTHRQSLWKNGPGHGL